MLRSCAECGRSFEAQRPAARYCGPTCRQRAKRGGRNAGSVPSIVPLASADIQGSEPSALVESVRSTLTEAGVLDTVAGQQALILAGRVGSPHETGAAVAALSKQLQALVDAALASVTRADQMDEVTRRRDEKLRRAGRA